MKRKIMSELKKWKASDKHLPLLIYGARQIGKTYILEQFGKEEFANVISVNFEKDRRLEAYLEISLAPKFILEALEKLYNQKIDITNTLIIFDEVQVCDRALTSLKYFSEELPECYIVAAGSLLGVKINRENMSFPVGKVHFLNMYPLDLEEYMWAKGNNALCEMIRECFNNNKPLPEILHQEALSIYHEYLVIGGMPAVVNAYLTKKNYTEVQNFLYNSYIADMTKYTKSSEAIKIAEAYDSLPAQLAKENKKFQYKLIKKGGRSSLYGNSIDWLIQAGIVLKCSLVEQGMFPLAAYQDLSSFKLYYSDMGIFSARINMTLDMLAYAGQFLGALTENYVAIALHSLGYELNYWSSNSEAEVDFVITNNHGVVPVEVKANDHVRSRSLNIFIKRYVPQMAIRISSRNFGIENGIKSIPLYAVFCMERNMTN